MRNSTSGQRTVSSTSRLSAGLLKNGSSARCFQNGFVFHGLSDHPKTYTPLPAYSLRPKHCYSPRNNGDKNHSHTTASLSRSANRFRPQAKSIVVDQAPTYCRKTAKCKQQ